jgi:hypothetical protein
MEHLVRVQNESDRKILAWLRERVGETALLAVVGDVEGQGKPYLSQVCRRLGVRPPWTVRVSTTRDTAHREVGEQHLAAIRQILRQGTRTRRGTLLTVTRAKT